jgi:hypothetical protein
LLILHSVTVSIRPDSIEVNKMGGVRAADSRRLFIYALSNVGLFGCCQSRIVGNLEMVSPLAAYSRKRGLGISLLGYNVLHTKYLFDADNRRDIEIPNRVTKGKPAILTSWGHRLVVQDGHVLRVTDLTGNVISELERTADVEGCVLHNESQLLLFWGKQHQNLQYGFYMADLRTHRLSTIYEFPMDREVSNAKSTASFAGDLKFIRVSVGFDAYLMQFDGALVKKEPWQMELVEGSPDGRFLVGRQRNGRLGLVDLRSSTTLDMGVESLGRGRWDPSSRYVLTVGRRQAFLWCAQTEIVVVDTFTRALLRLPPIIPDSRDHPYEWVLLPDGKPGP